MFRFFNFFGMVVKKCTFNTENRITYVLEYYFYSHNITFTYYSVDFTLLP